MLRTLVGTNYHTGIVAGLSAERSRSGTRGRPSSAIARTISARSMEMDISTPRSPAAPRPYTVRPSDETGAGTERQCLHDVSTPPYAAVEEHFDSVAGRVDDLRQYLERRRQPVELTATVVRDEDSIDALVGRAHGVLGAHDPLDDDAALPDRAKRHDVFPCECGIELLIDVSRERKWTASRAAVRRDVREFDARTAKHLKEPPRALQNFESILHGDARRDRRAVSVVALALTEDGHIRRDHEHLVSGGRRASDQRVRERAIAPD